MSRKTIIWITLAIGSTVGGMIPMLWGGSFTSMSSIILTAVGGFLGIYIGFRLSEFVS